MAGQFVRMSAASPFLPMLHDARMTVNRTNLPFAVLSMEIV